MGVTEQWWEKSTPGSPRLPGSLLSVRTPAQLYFWSWRGRLFSGGLIRRISPQRHLVSTQLGRSSFWSSYGVWHLQAWLQMLYHSKLSWGLLKTENRISMKEFFPRLPIICSLLHLKCANRSKWISNFFYNTVFYNNFFYNIFFLRLFL